LDPRHRNNPRKLPPPASPAGQHTLPTPTAVIFDIGRVIVRLDMERAFEPIAAGMQGAGAPSGKCLSSEDIWALIRADECWDKWQEGRISPSDWHRRLMDILKLSLTLEEFRDAWNRVLNPQPILSDELFAQLGARCRLALLSNTDPIHVECLERSFTFGRYFPTRIYSCGVGASKPSPAIYQAALDSLGVPAREALYIDDIQEFVDAARRLGLDSIRFEDPALLAAELRRRGLLQGTGDPAVP
jgi:glucose-1-phosphatase